MTRVAACLSFGALAACASGGADLPAPLSLPPAQATELRVSAVRIALDSIYRQDIGSRRIWLLVEQGDTEGQASSTPEEEAALTTAFPSARLITSLGEAFDCPPGVTVAPPLVSCDVRENGIVIRLGTLSVEPNAAVIHTTLTQSVRQGDSVHTFAEGHALEFTRRSNAWVYVRSRWVIKT